MAIINIITTINFLFLHNSRTLWLHLHNSTVRTTLYVNKQHHKKVLLSSFHLDGHTQGFYPQAQ